MTFQQFLTTLKARKGAVLLVLLVTLGATCLASALLPARWTATASVLVDARRPDPVTGSSLSAQMLPGYIATQVDVIQSRTVALKVVDALHLQEGQVTQEKWRKATEGRGSLKVWLADRLLKKLDVKPSRESTVIDISFSWTDPKLASAVANAFARAYVDTTLELKVDSARQQAKWFGERTQSLRREVERSAAKLATYQQQKSIVSLDDRLDTESARLEQYNAQLSQATAQTADALARQRLARDAAARGIAPDSLPEVVGNLLIQSLKRDLSRKEGNLKQLSLQLGPNNPQYQEAAADVENARTKLRAEMARIVASLTDNLHIAEQREADLRAQTAAQKTKVLSLKKERDGLSVLMRDAENAQKVFDATTQRYNQTTLESQATQTNVAMLAPAVEPIQSSFPKWPLNIALSIFFGTLLGVCVAVFMEMLDRRMRNEEDVTSMLALPLLATMPRQIRMVPRRSARHLDAARTWT